MPQSAEPRLRDALAGLPDPPLPAELWPRVSRARHRQVARRRLALAGTAAVAFAALLLPAGWMERTQAPDPVARIATAQDPPPRAAASPDTAARLRSLDRELQAAYRRGSDSAEIAQLWEARSALLRARPPAPSARPVRI